MIVNKNPLKSTFDRNGFLEHNENATSSIITSRGSMSSALNTFNIGVILPTSWIGEGIVVKNFKSPYSIIADSQIKVLRISRKDMLEKLPKDFLE